MKIALIYGITGQDGSYLAEFLLKKKYIIHGVIRRSSSFNTGRIDHLHNNPNLINKRFFLHYGDLTDTSNINRLIEKISPDEIYNLGAQSHVKVSFEIPEYTSNVDALGTLRILDSIKDIGLKSKFYQASTSELYGNSSKSSLNEKSEFRPCSPYAISKLYSYWLVKNYREAYGIFACNGILFNHESERRGKTFVTRKISIGVSKIILGVMDYIELGNLNAKRDWGYAPEYVEGMWKIMTHEEADDYVLATGKSYSIRQFIETAFKLFDEELYWRGSGDNEKGYLKSNSKCVVKINQKYFRPTEVECLIGDSSKANKELNWYPKTDFSQLVNKIVKFDFDRLKKIYGK